MKKKDKRSLSEFDYHEALDRTGMMADMVNSYLIQHQVSKVEKEFAKKVKRAGALLAEAYQIIGHESLKLSE
jgi:hypothetical protein